MLLKLLISIDIIKLVNFSYTAINGVFYFIFLLLDICVGLGHLCRFGTFVSVWDMGVLF